VLRFIVCVSSIVLVTGSKAAVVYDEPLTIENHSIPAARGQLAQTYICRRFPGFVLKSVRWEDRTTFDDHFVQPYRREAPSCRPEAPWTPSSVIGSVSGVLGRFIVRESVYQDRDDIGVYDTATGQDVLTATATAAPESMRLTGDGFVLRFRRVYEAPCSLYYGTATACWAEVRAATGLTEAMLPDCAARYEMVGKKWSIPAEKMRTHRSQLFYAVEACYSGGKLTYAALPGEALCRASY
jgi:hypothetical protein